VASTLGILPHKASWCETNRPPLSYLMGRSRKQIVRRYNFRSGGGGRSLVDTARPPGAP